MFLIDTNVLSDMLAPESPWRAWSENAVGDALEQGDLCINPVIYAEIAAGVEDLRELEARLRLFPLVRLGLPYEAAFLAARALAEHRRRGGLRTSPLGDFYIGGHAAFSRLVLITRDPRPYRTYFRSVTLVTPATV